jgi:hypothetical protein
MTLKQRLWKTNLSERRIGASNEWPIPLCFAVSGSEILGSLEVLSIGGLHGVWSIFYESYRSISITSNGPTIQYMPLMTAIR